MRRLSTAVALLAALVFPATLAQVAPGLLDVNTAQAAQLGAIPGLKSAIVDELIEQRPFASIVALDAALKSAGLSDEQRAAVYEKAFIHIDLNRASEAELLLVPGAGPRMAHEFEEYRPWKSWAQFDREIGKYVDEAQTNRFKQYLFIPLGLNSASEEAFKTIPGVGGRMAHEFEEYRPWKSEAQFRREIGKYVDEAEVERLWRYLVID